MSESQSIFFLTFYFDSRNPKAAVLDPKTLLLKEEQKKANDCINQTI